MVLYVRTTASCMPVCRAIKMQPAVVIPTYVSRPYLAASVVDSYRHRQSTVIGILLIIVGGLSIVFNVVDLAVGSTWYSYNRYRDYYNPYYVKSLSDRSNGITGHGIWCGAMVSIQSFKSSCCSCKKHKYSMLLFRRVYKKFQNPRPSLSRLID